MRDFNKIDKVFREGLKNHEVVPSYKNWYEIEQKLPAEGPTYKTGYFWAALGSFTCIAIFATFMIYFFHNYSIQISSKNSKLASSSTSIQANSLNQPLYSPSVPIINNDCLEYAVSNPVLALENSFKPSNIINSSDEIVQAEIVQPEVAKEEIKDVRVEIIEPKVLQEKIKSVENSDHFKKVNSSKSSGKWLAFLNKLNLYKKVKNA